jgi:VWFA-related protein
MVAWNRSQPVRKYLIPVSLLLAVFVCGVFGQERESEHPVLRVSNYSVVVDVVVTDKDNRHVTDLTGDDFILLEDGVPQEIEWFYSVNSTGQVGSSPETEFAGEDEPPLIKEASSFPNLVIFLMDYATVEYLNQNYIRDAAAQFVRERTKPDDLMAVFHVGRSLHFLQPFTNDKSAVIAALSKMNTAGSFFAADQGMTTQLAENVQNEVEILTASIDNLSSAGAPVSPQFLAIIRSLSRELEIAQSREGLYYAQRSYSREMQSRPIIGAIETIARGVRHIPGRKTLILFSQGFSVPATLERPLYRAVDLANKANLAVYAVDAGGLQFKQVSTEGELYDISALRSGDRVRAYGGLSQFDRAREIGSDQKDSTLRYIAAATGGFFVRFTNDFVDALDRIDQDVRSHYVLAYRPKNSDFRGEFREISVTTKREGLKIRARSGYWGIPPGASLLSSGEYRELLAAPTSKLPEPLAFYSQLAHFRAGDRRYRVDLSLEVPLSELQPAQEEGFYLVDLDTIGFVQDQTGEIVTSFRGPSRVRLGERRFQTTETLRFDTQLSLPAGRYSVSILVSDPSSARKGFQQRALYLPEIRKGLAVSSLVLGKTDELLRTDSTDPLAVDNIRVSPSASRSFSNGQDLVYLLNVYDIAERASGSFGLELEIELFCNGRIVGRQLEKGLSGTFQADPLPHLRLARYLELKDFRPGSYLIRATVRDPVQNEARSAQTTFQLQ